MKIFTTKMLGLVISALLLGACSQMATYENEDLTNGLEKADQPGFKLNPFGVSSGLNVRTVCGFATTKNARRLTGSAAILATDYGDITVSNDQNNLYIDIDAPGLTPSRYSYFLGDETTIVNNGGLNNAFDAKPSQSSYTIPLSDITMDVDLITAGQQIDLAVIFETTDGGSITKYWAEGTQFTNITLNHQGNGVQTRYFTYTIQTDCPEADCYGPEEGAWTEGFEYNPGKNFSEYSSLTGLLAGVKLQAGGQYVHVGDANATEYLGKDNEELVSIAITLLSGYVFGDESYDEEGNLLPGSIFVQPFSQEDVDNGTIPGLQNNNNPAPGQFDYDFHNVTGTKYTISGLPKADFYGIKTAVQAIIDCPTE